MAKSKKITIEGALVPIEEQPYEVPGNWCWVYHNGILDISGGSQPAKSLFIDEPREGYTQLYQTRDYGEHPVPVFIPDEYATKTTEEGDILLARYGGSLGKVFRAHNGAYNVALAKVVKLFPKLLDDKYTYLYYCSSFYQDFCVKASSGRSAQAGFNRNDMNKLIFPLPPIAEQQRIAMKIESLFSRLDEARDKAQEVVDGFDSRRAAILAQAFSGKLTEKWRRENNHSLDELKDSVLSEVVSGFKYGSSEKSTYENDGIPVLRIPNIGDGIIDFSDMKFLSHNSVDLENQVHEDDILIIRSNGSRDLVGKCAIVPSLEKNYTYASFLIRIKPSEVILPRFLLLYLNSSIARSQMFIKAKSSSGIHNINSKELGAIRIKVPCFEEQKEVVRILDEIFAKENEARILAEIVADEIDAVKKSILVKAFRGELGTNDSSDEPAEELLKRILTETPVEEKKISTTIRTKVKAVMNKDMLEAVKEAGRITPERLKEETGLGIDEFYEELKRLTESGQVLEKREDGDVYLEVRDAN